VKAFASVRRRLSAPARRQRVRSDAFAGRRRVLVVLLNCWPPPPHDPRVSEPDILEFSEFHGHQCDGSIQGDADAGLQGQSRQNNPNRRTKKSTASDLQSIGHLCATKQLSPVLLCISDRQNRNFQPRDLLRQTITAAGQIFDK